MASTDTTMTDNPTPNLAPYATRATGSRDRRHDESTHHFRNPFQRDRDRVIHSRAFRRLDGKTQVFLNGSGDHFRTRLTHTIEVATIARTIARRLDLNEDLTEAIGLAHDLGHTPFGHMGERVLNSLMADHGGFDHNLQALRIADILEHKYPTFRGLNLTWEVRNGLIKHREPNLTTLDDCLLPPSPSLEAQVADVADDLAYYTHDVDDGIAAGLLTEEQLMDVGLWQRARGLALEDGATPGSEAFVSYAVRCLINMLVDNVLEHSAAELHRLDPPAAAAVTQLPARIIGFTPEFEALNLELRTFLFSNVYRHPDLVAVNDRAGKVVRNLFAWFVRKPEQLGAGAKARIEEFGIDRCAADYVAGMTDHFALDLHRQLTRTDPAAKNQGILRANFPLAPRLI